MKRILQITVVLATLLLAGGVATAHPPFSYNQQFFNNSQFSQQQFLQTNTQFVPVTNFVPVTTQSLITVQRQDFVSIPQIQTFQLPELVNFNQYQFQTLSAFPVPYNDFRSRRRGNFNLNFDFNFRGGGGRRSFGGGW